MEKFLIIVMLGFIVWKAVDILKRRQAQRNVNDAEILQHGEEQLEKRARMKLKNVPYVVQNLTEGISQMNPFPYSSYEEWFTAYREAAANANPSLRMSETNGNNWSKVNLMDGDIAQKAYACQLDPVLLGDAFGRKFIVEIEEFAEAYKAINDLFANRQ